MKGLKWGALLKRKTCMTMDDDVQQGDTKRSSQHLSLCNIPACFKTDFLPIIEKQLGGSACAQIKGLKACKLLYLLGTHLSFLIHVLQGQSSNRYEYFVDHSSKHQEALRCCKDPSKIHTSNRKKIFVNFEKKEVLSYDKKTKTRITRTYPPGIYMECFKGCNSDKPKMVLNYKGPKGAPPSPVCTIEPVSPLLGDTALQVEVPRHDAFSIEIKGIGTFTNATPYLKHPYSANPIPKIKRNMESAEYYQAMGVPMETRCYLINF